MHVATGGLAYNIVMANGGCCYRLCILRYTCRRRFEFALMHTGLNEPFLWCPVVDSGRQAKNILHAINQTGPKNRKIGS